ncbi:MAG: hypothetical protein ACK5MA_03260 [Parachlamydiaceae bacterium]
MQFEPIVNQKKFLGVRLSAVWETLLFLFILTLGNYLFSDGARFITYKYHPFWIIILLTSSIYGAVEGLFAALLSTLVLYYRNIPEIQADQSLFEYELQVGLLPALWLIVAFVLGEIRSSVDWRLKTLSEAALHADSKAEKIAAEFTSLKEQNHQLSLSLSSKEETVSSAFEAFKTLETIDPAQVILGLDSIVHLSLRPRKFSVYAMGPSGLEAAKSKGWTEEDHYTRRFTESTPIYNAMIHERRLISVINRQDQKIMGKEGILASPLIDPDTNAVFGMIKVEEIEFQNLNLIRLESFKTVCELIGKFYANSKRLKRTKEESLYAVKGLYSYAFYGTLSTYMRSLAKEFHCRLAEFVLRSNLTNLSDAHFTELKGLLPPSTLIFQGARVNELLFLKPMLQDESTESVKQAIVKAVVDSKVAAADQIKLTEAVHHA